VKPASAAGCSGQVAGAGGCLPWQHLEGAGRNEITGLKIRKKIAREKKIIE